MVDFTVPFIKDEPLRVLMLVTPLTEYNQKVPVIVGTNIIRYFTAASSDDNMTVPECWKVAFSSICNNHIGIVKAKHKVVLQPMESKTISGFTWKSKVFESAVTVPAENGSSSRVTVCPRVVRLDKPGTSARIPVRICNLSAEVVTIAPKSPICELKEVTVLRSADITSKSSGTCTANVQQQTASSAKDTSADINLADSCLSEEQKKHANKFLSQWQHIFSRRPTDLGHTKTVQHERHLDNEQPFNEPYRHSPPTLIQEVREHLREMLQIAPSAQMW